MWWRRLTFHVMPAPPRRKCNLLCTTCLKPVRPGFRTQQRRSPPRPRPVTNPKILFVLCTGIAAHKTSKVANSLRVLLIIGCACLVFIYSAVALIAVHKSIGLSDLVRDGRLFLWTHYLMLLNQVHDVLTYVGSTGSRSQRYSAIAMLFQIRKQLNEKDM